MIPQLNGSQHGQDLELGKVLYRWAANSNCALDAGRTLAIGEKEVTLIARMPVEKTAGGTGLMNLIMSDFIMVTRTRAYIDGALAPVGPAFEERKISVFEAAKWLASNMGKTIIDEILTVDFSLGHFALDRRERYGTVNYNEAKSFKYIGYADAEKWSQENCGVCVDFLVNRLRMLNA